MKTCKIPVKEKTSATDHHALDKPIHLADHLPNLFSVLIHLGEGVANYLSLDNDRSSLNDKEREVVRLVVSNVNKCFYCLSAQIEMGKMEGFTDEQVSEIIRAEITFDVKLDALAKLVKNMVEKQGYADPQLVEYFYTTGYDECNLIDLIMTVGDKMMTNYILALTGVPVEFPIVLNYNVLSLMMMISPADVQHRGFSMPKQRDV